MLKPFGPYGVQKMSQAPRLFGKSQIFGFVGNVFTNDITLIIAMYCVQEMLQTFGKK